MSADYRPSFAALVLAGGAQIDFGAIAGALSLLGDSSISERLLVLGQPRDHRLPEWRVMQAPNAAVDPLESYRVGMTALPLLDAFYLIDLDSPAPLAGPSALAAMAERYVEFRLSLGRIVVPTVQGQSAFPWLIDIGFRQPFIERDPARALASVLDANASQVTELAVG